MTVATRRLSLTPISTMKVKVNFVLFTHRTIAISDKPRRRSFLS